MNCPKCNAECYRDEVDVGVGLICGPYGCMCGWSEDQEYDSSEGPSLSQKMNPDQVVLSTGSLISKKSIANKLEHFGLPKNMVDEL